PTHHAQAAGAVPDLVAREPVAERVGDPGGDALRPGIVALAPPAHRRVGALEGRQQGWEIPRIVLKVGVERRHDPPARGTVARVARGRQPRVRVEAEESNPGIRAPRGAYSVGAP